MSDEIVRAVETAEVIAFPGCKGERTPPPVDPPKDDGDLNRRLAAYPRTDLGNAERLAERYRDKLLHCEALGWLGWDGRRWSRHLGNALVKDAEHATARAIQDEAASIEGTRLDFEIEDAKGNKVLLSQALRRHGRASEARVRLSAMSDRATSMLKVSVSELDEDQFRFNCLNGTLVLGRQENGDYWRLAPHDPADRLTKLAPVNFDPQATCPAFDKFLEEVQPSEDVRRFLAVWAGYSLTGDTGEHKLVFHYGRGRNGKSVWINALRDVAGDYGAAIPIESFLDSGRARAAGQATPDLANLPGVRCLTTTEPEKGSKLAEGILKQLTGGDEIRARHLNRDYFAFMPQLKLTIAGNYRPQITGTDEGIWSRIVLVPWGIYIPPERRDPHLSERLREEASGILNLFLGGLRDWFKNGLVLPQSAVEATRQYREDNDPLGRFLDACTKPAIGERVVSTEMHIVFCAWAKANGERPWTPTGFGKAMRDRGFTTVKNSLVFWLDITLTKCVGDFESHPDESAGHSEQTGYSPSDESDSDAI